MFHPMTVAPTLSVISVRNPLPQTPLSRFGTPEGRDGGVGQKESLLMPPPIPSSRVKLEEIGDTLRFTLQGPDFILMSLGLLACIVFAV